MVVLLTVVGFLFVAHMLGLRERHKMEFAKYQESFVMWRSYRTGHDTWWGEHGEKLRKVA